jgi:dTDP-4-dehydrorhamnose 3,5-epimerase
MQIQEVFIEGLKIIEPKIFEDERGLFYESYNALQFEKAGILDTFLQDNQSLSKKGVLRGLHFQTGNFAQAKLVRVIKGAVIDIAVDLRKNSSTFGKHFALELNNRNNFIFYIPVGFAHGFVAIEDDTIFSYKCSAVYNKESEGGIIWNDHLLNIDWAYPNPVLSEKDKILPAFNPEITFF